MLTIYPETHDQKAVEFCQRFLSDSAPPRYVLGRNEYAASIAAAVDVDGFIDEFTHERFFLGKPIVPIVEVPKEGLVVSTAVGVLPSAALSRLKECGLTCLDYFAFLRLSGLPLENVPMLSDGSADIERNWRMYQWTYDLLEDDGSKEVLERLLNFRASGALSWMSGFEHAPDRQYFEDFVKLRPGEVFVDAGGFDGETSVAFIERCPAYRSVHLFEPDSTNMELARSNLSGCRGVHFHATGLAASRGTMRFSPGGGSASKVTETGDVEIPVDAIDNVIEEPISFVKMDIEGAEGIALAGAKSHISRDHPKLAVSCYHNVDDIWKLPEQVVAIRDDYSLHVRHYTEGTEETVMYFIPRS